MVKHVIDISIFATHFLIKGEDNQQNFYFSCEGLPMGFEPFAW